MTKIWKGPTLIWAVLIALTIISIFSAERLDDFNLAMIAIFGIAMVKTYLVMIYYMEVLHAARHWKIIYLGWTIAATLLMILGHIGG